MQEPPCFRGAEVALLLLCGVSMTVLLPLLSPLRAMLLTVSIVAGLIGPNMLVWQQSNFVLPLASSLIMVALLFALDMSCDYFVESRAKRQITGRSGQHVPVAVVDEMSGHSEAISTEGEHREVSVFFKDIRGFTSISERLHPKEFTNFVKEFLTPLTRLIHRHHGTIEKYPGDYVMALRGAPLPDILFRELDRVVVSGKNEPVPIYEPIGRRDEVQKVRLDGLKLWAQLQRLYRSRDPNTAEVQLLNLQKIDGMQRLNRQFLQRSAKLLRNPPDACWLGAYRFEAK